MYEEIRPGVIDPAQVQKTLKLKIKPLYVVDLRSREGERAYKNKVRCQSGVYMLLHKKTGHVYVGKTVDMFNYPFGHFYKDKCSMKMQKYMVGNTPSERKVNFYLVVLEIVPEEALGDTEVKWFCQFNAQTVINTLMPSPSGIGAGCLTPEQKEQGRALAKIQKREWEQELNNLLLSYLSMFKILSRKKQGHQRKLRSKKTKITKKWGGFGNNRSQLIRLTNLRDPSIVVEIASTNQAAEFLGYGAYHTVKHFLASKVQVAYSKQKTRFTLPKFTDCWFIEKIPKKAKKSPYLKTLCSCLG